MVKRNYDSEFDVALWRRITESCGVATTSIAQPPPSEAQDEPSTSGLSLATLITKGTNAALHRLTHTLRSSGSNKGWHGRLDVLRDL